MKAGKHRNLYLQRSFKEHGIDKLSFSIIEITTKKKLLERERYWMDFYKSCDSTFGYNLYKDPTRPGYEKGCFTTEMRDRYGIKRTVDFISPDGKVYKDIKNVTRFAEEHGLHPVGMNEVARGKRGSHRGWKNPNSNLELSIGGRKRKVGKFNIKLINESGKIFIVQNLQKFCEELNLNYTPIHNLISGVSRKSLGFKLLEN